MSYDIAVVYGKHSECFRFRSLYKANYVSHVTIIIVSCIQRYNICVERMKSNRKRYVALVAAITFIFMAIYFLLRTESRQAWSSTLREALRESISSGHGKLKTNESETISTDDIYVSIKTCGKFHKSRVSLILNTWWDAIKKQAS